MVKILNEDDKITTWLADLGISEIDRTLLCMTFTHPSYKGIDPIAEDYEKLEFLGDAVLNLVSAEELMRDFVDAEGVMTEKRKALVNNEFLAHIFNCLAMGEFLHAAINYRPSVKDKANVVEALMGAVFLSPNLSPNYETCKTLWDTIRARIGALPAEKIVPATTLEEQTKQEAFQSLYRELGLVPKNAKSSLQELCQMQGLPLPEYTEQERVGPDHDPTICVKVVANPVSNLLTTTYITYGEGRTKKSAEIRAAEALCDQIYLPYLPLLDTH